MRFFPSASSRRVVSTAVVATFAVGSLAIPLAYAADDDLKDKQKHVQGQINGAKADLDESSKEVSSSQAAYTKAHAQLVSARSALAAANEKLAAAQARDAATQARLDAAVARLAAAQADLEAGREAVQAQRDAVADSIADIYEQGTPGMLALDSLLSSASTEDYTRGMALNDVVVRKQTNLYEDLAAAEAALRERKVEVADAKKERSAQRAAAAEHLVEIQGLREQALTAAAAVRSKVLSAAAARRAAHEARAHDLAVLAKLKKEDARIKRKILAAAAAAAAKGQSPSYSGSADGYLLPPVTGPVTSPFGYRIHPIYGYWGLHDGTDFGVSCGEGMRAVSAGTVTAQYYSDVYGNRLYLDVGRINGHNITVVYNHATGYRVGPGDRVSRGEIVGYVGSTGWSTGCHLHFTVLQDGVAVDPMKYL